jgi:hypothetical protein
MRGNRNQQSGTYAFFKERVLKGRGLEFLRFIFSRAGRSDVGNAVSAAQLARETAEDKQEAPSRIVAGLSRERD